MNRSPVGLRRLILGLSIEDAQSKFDSSESRQLLRVAHERHNQGILHELTLAQQQRNKMPAEKKCHICRYTKPSVRGFQGYIKETPDDYVVTELWPNVEDRTATENGSEADAGDQSATAVAIATHTGAVVSAKVADEMASFSRYKETVLEALRDALDNVRSNVLVELAERRQSGALVAGQQPSVLDRLVDEASESSDKGYKTLSSSSHLLEPVQMELSLYGKKDKEVAEAFKSPLLSIPAKEGDISFSLWVAGGLIADEETASEFPYHIAKYVTPTSWEDNANRLPRVDVEVYFSPELYQIQRTIGKAGVVALRKFIGQTMMRQHEPTPVSSTLLLNASTAERELMNLYDPTKVEAIRLPWIRKTRSLVSTLTGVTFKVEDAVEDNATMEKMRDSLLYVWRIWGHLIKDLHVYGDLDYLYVSIDRRKEMKENLDYIKEVGLLEQGQVGSETALVTSDSGEASPPANLRKRGAARGLEKKKVFYPVAADFTVIECVLERKGLPHNMVVEDITEMLTEMQTQSMEMARLAVVEEIQNSGEGEHGSSIIPVLYSPKVVVSHAGVIENGSHSFQRIRIRGSTLAHVEALIAALKDSDYFTSRADVGRGSVLDGTPADSASNALSLPKNLTFSATHEVQTAAILRQSERLLGHKAATERSGAGRFRRHQTTQALDFMTVTEDERSFWKENFYRLSAPKVLFQDRVDPADLGIGEGPAAMKKTPSPRLLEHLRVVNNRLTAGEADGGDEGDGHSQSAAATTKKGKKGRRKSTRKKKTPDVAHIPPEKMFEYLCTDMEAETSHYDLRAGQCSGYAYQLNVRRVPSKQVQLVSPAVHSVATKGFINYFGPLRFATYTKLNMHPGLHLLKGEFRAAAHVIVQQFYVDLAMQAEKRRTGVAFPQALAMKGPAGVRLADFVKGGRRSVAEHGTAMQKVLSNALQASLLMAGGDGDADAALDGEEDFLANAATTPSPLTLGRPANEGWADFADMIDSDPCADAFLNVIGPNACHVLIHEFLAFLWNDIVNQRLQRYGTFAILPGDLVRRHPDAPRGSPAYNELRRVTRREVEHGRKRHWDVVLPIPGANIELPDNHTTDLYVVTLKRMGLLFNPEARQWECFYPRLWGPVGGKATGAAHRTPPSMSGGGVPLTSPYRCLSPSHQLMEEELGFQTPFTEALPRQLFPSAPSQQLASPSAEVLFDPEMDGGEDGRGSLDVTGSRSSIFDAAGLRPDLQRQTGNPLNLLIEAGYRHPIFQPGDNLRWQLSTQLLSDPHQRWGASRGAAHRSGQQPHSAEGPRKVLLSSSSPSAAATATGARGPIGSYIPASVSPDGSHQLGATLVLPTMARSATPRRPSYPLLPASLAGAGGGAVTAPPTAPSRWRNRRLPWPKSPYWLPQHNDACLSLAFELPTGVYPSMLLRELTKLDVNSPDVVDVNRPSAESQQRAASWQSLTTDQQDAYRRFLTKRRQRAFTSERPHAVSLALLHQQIFRSGGTRGSLLPTLRSYDSVTK